MNESRRLWFPLDALFPEQAIVETLQAEHGAAGPWTFVWLLCDAYKRHFLKERPSGVVNMSYRRLAEKSGVLNTLADDPTETVRGVMRNLQGARIVEFVEGDLESATFRVRFSKWEDWLPGAFADPTNADRQARHRAKKAGARDSGDTVTRYVTASNARGDVDGDSPQPRPEVARLSNLLADLIRQRDPKARVTPGAKRWLDSIRLLLDADERSETEVEHVIRWSQEGRFLAEEHPVRAEAARQVRCPVREGR
jgi:hypothetical protein